MTEKQLARLAMYEGIAALMKGAKVLDREDVLEALVEVYKLYADGETVLLVIPEDHDAPT